jgi:hypothetical protein
MYEPFLNTAAGLTFALVAVMVATSIGSALVRHLDARKMQLAGIRGTRVTVTRGTDPIAGANARARPAPTAI